MLQRLVALADRRADVSGLALVGSWARGAPRPGSDLDVVLLTDEPSRYVEDDDWLREVGGARLVRTAAWGAITERRFALPGGMEVELGVGTPSWASLDPLDRGAAEVVAGGLRVLYDRDRHLAALLAACGK